MAFIMLTLRYEEFVIKVHKRVHGVRPRGLDRGHGGSASQPSGQTWGLLSSATGSRPAAPTLKSASVAVSVEGR